MGISLVIVAGGTSFTMSGHVAVSIGDGGVVCDHCPHNGVNEDAIDNVPAGKY